MKKPLIGITCGSIDYTGEGPFWGTGADGIHQHYANSVALAGGIPVLLPTTMDKELIFDMVSRVDGVLLTGGQDVDPLLYSEPPHQNLGPIFHRRDVFDICTIRFALDADKPILGICRGCQVLNVACGGTLYQDLPTQKQGVHAHSQLGDPSVPSHVVNIAKDSLLTPFMGESTVINSLHHQAVKQIAPGFLPIATAEDGVIEAIQKQVGFALGVQWHPEWMSAHDEQSLMIFKLLVEAAK